MRLLLKGLFGITALLSLTVFLVFYIDGRAPAPKNISYGLSYSPRYATYLGLNWQQAYLETLDELHPATVRLSAYWDEIAPTPTTYFFDDLDFLVNEAAKRNVSVILAIGQKLPRWPECYQPTWIKGDVKKPLLEYLTAVVGHYKAENTITHWQVENEPYFDFGKCQGDLSDTIEKEVALVRKLDSSRQIIVTDSGEWGWFNHVNDLTDYLGISVYRQVSVVGLGKITLPLPANYYRLRSRLLNWNLKDVMITELQMEPWLTEGARDMSIDQQLKIFNATSFRNNLKFAQNTGFNKIILWGTEWWLYLREQGHPEVWVEAKKAFQL